MVRSELHNGCTWSSGIWGHSPSREKTERIHCARLKKYRASLLGSVIPDEMLDIAEKNESRYEVIDEIVDVGRAEGGLFFQVKWGGLLDQRDMTWN